MKNIKSSDLNFMYWAIKHGTSVRIIDGHGNVLYGKIMYELEVIISIFISVALKVHNKILCKSLFAALYFDCVVE